MFLNQNRKEMRQVFFESWQRYREGLPLGPLAQQLVAIITQHPEYHSIFEDPERNAERTYFPELGETNPFFHISLHLSLLEQIQTNRPTGIGKLFAQLAHQLGDVQKAEHAIMNCISENLWQAQQTGKPVDDAGYLAQIEALIKR